MHQTPGGFRFAFAAIMLAALVAALVAVAAGQEDASAALPTTPADGIENIQQLLDSCPQNDPNYAMFRADFALRRDGAVVGEVPCSEPVSAMPISQFSDELIVLQGLRVIYYMEGGRSVPYPWTSLSMYDWMKSRIGGIEVAFSTSHCCEYYDGEFFIVLASQSDFNREPDKRWTGLSERIAIMGHETRHRDNFPHVGGCPLFPGQTFGCDQRYDEANLSPYGFQWWLNAKWLSGEINVGYSCLLSAEVNQIATTHLNRANNDYGKRFVENSPPLLTMPAQPGGRCGGEPVTPTASPTASPTRTPSPTPSPTASPAPTVAPTTTATPTAPPPASPTNPPAPTSTAAPTPAASPPPTATPTPTLSPAASATPSSTYAPTPLPTATATATPLHTATSSPPKSPVTPTPTPTPTPAETTRPAPDASPSPTATPTPSSTASPIAGIPGDLDCDADIDAVDALHIQRFVALLPNMAPSGCANPGITTADIDCDQDVDSVDALKLLRYVAGLPFSQSEPCPDIGS